MKRRRPAVVGRPRGAAEIDREVAGLVASFSGAPTGDLSDRLYRLCMERAAGLRFSVRGMAARRALVRGMRSA